MSGWRWRSGFFSVMGGLTFSCLLWCCHGGNANVGGSSNGLLLPQLHVVAILFWALRIESCWIFLGFGLDVLHSLWPVRMSILCNEGYTSMCPSPRIEWLEWHVLWCWCSHKNCNYWCAVAPLGGEPCFRMMVIRGENFPFCRGFASYVCCCTHEVGGLKYITKNFQSLSSSYLFSALIIPTNRNQRLGYIPANDTKAFRARSTTIKSYPHLPSAWVVDSKAT